MIEGILLKMGYWVFLASWPKRMEMAGPVEKSWWRLAGNEGTYYTKTSLYVPFLPANDL